MSYLTVGEERFGPVGCDTHVQVFVPCEQHGMLETADPTVGPGYHADCPDCAEVQGTPKKGCVACAMTLARVEDHVRAVEADRARAESMRKIEELAR